MGVGYILLSICLQSGVLPSTVILFYTSFLCLYALLRFTQKLSTNEEIVQIVIKVHIFFHG